MSHMEDDGPPIKTHPASREYRENFDRIFGDRPPASVSLSWTCPCCEPGRHIVMIDTENRVFECALVDSLESDRNHGFDDVKEQP